MPANAIIGGAMGIATGAYGATNQQNRQKELMGISYGHQRNLNIQGQQLQMDTWKRTNYPAQIEMMRKAGLNPALMYGMKGGGGTTTGSQTGGQAQAGQAQAFNPMDMSNLMLVGAQIDEIKSRTDLNKALEKKAGGIETEGIAQQIKTEEGRRLWMASQEEGQRIMNEINKASSRDQIGKHMAEFYKTMEEARSIAIQNEVDENTIDENIKIKEEEAIGASLENLFKVENIKLTRAQTEAVSSVIERNLAEASSAIRNATSNERQAKVAETRNWIEKWGKELDKVMQDDRIKKDKQVAIIQGVSYLIGSIISGAGSLLGQYAPKKTIN